MKGDGRKAKNPKKTLARLLSYLKPYRFTLVLVVICILLSSLASALSSDSLDPLIEDYIKPLTGQQNPNFAPLVKFLVRRAIIYLVGIASTFLYNILMVVQLNIKQYFIVLLKFIELIMILLQDMKMVGK